MLGVQPLRLFLLALLLAASSLTLGCKRKPAADRHLEEAYRLLPSDPKAALAELRQVQNPADPRALLARGLALEKLRDYGEAEKVLQEACAGTAEPRAWLALGRVRVVLGKLDAAREAIDRALAQDPSELAAVLLDAFLAHDDARARSSLARLGAWRKQALGRKEPLEIPAELYLSQALLYRQLGMRTEFDGATEQAKGARLSKSRGALALVELAVKAGRPGLAVELLRKIERDQPSADLRRQVAKLAHGLGDHRLAGDILDTLPGDDVELVTLRAEHDFATGRPEATAGLRRALELTKDPAEESRLRLLLTEACLRGGQLEEARTEAERLLEDHPTDAAVLVLARVDLGQKAPTEALKRLAPLLAATRASAATRELAASAHLALGQRDEARLLLDELLLKQPTQIRAARLRVALEVDSGRPKVAAGLAQELVRRAPADAGLRLLLAEAVGKAEGSAAAARSLEESARALSGNVRLWLAAAVALEESKAGAAALAALEEAHQKLPQEGLLTAALAAKLAKVGQAERAAALYGGLIQRADGDPVLLNNLAVLYADDLRDPGRAVTLAERAYALSQEPPIADTLGWALYRRSGPGDLERAKTLLEGAAGVLGSPTARYHLGAVLIATGSESEGKVLLAQALAQADDFPGVDHARALREGEPPAPQR